jgi:beta-glucosidase/6-phospho-beta-glucosidase/beta-galactosidase
LKFPNSFQFGAATAAYQIEGAWNVDGKVFTDSDCVKLHSFFLLGRTPSIWDTLTHDHPERIADRSNGDIAANSYELYPEDIKLMKNLDVSHFDFIDS